MPDDVAEEKVKALQALEADVIRVRPASIVDKKQVCSIIPSSEFKLITYIPIPKMRSQVCGKSAEPVHLGERPSL